MPVEASAVSGAVVVHKGAVLIRFEQRYIIISSATFFLLNSIRKQRKSILTYDSGSVAGNNLNFMACLQNLFCSRAHESLFFTTLYKFTLTDGQ